MSSIIYFRMAQAKNKAPEEIAFEGSTLKLFQLKKQICERKFPKTTSTDFDFRITDSEGGKGAFY
jgi:DWNN domain